MTLLPQLLKNSLTNVSKMSRFSASISQDNTAQSRSFPDLWIRSKSKNQHNIEEISSLNWISAELSQNIKKIEAARSPTTPLTVRKKAGTKPVSLE